MTLVELYNKNCVSYYGIEYSAERLFIGDDKESEAVRCKEFMHEHYMAGKKHELLDSALYTQYESKGKHVHSVSLYLLGKALLPHFQQEIDKKLTAFLPHYSGWHDHNRDFLHTWFLTSMYHDFASCIEFGTIQANDSERHRSLAFHLGNHDIRYSIYGDYPYKTQNVPIRFSKELIENYFYYRACSGACEHGIIAGNLFFDRFVKTFLKATKENRFDEAGNWDGRDGNWNTDMIKTNAGIRTIPMLDTVKDAFEMLKEEQEESGQCDVEIDGMTGFIFCNRFGNVPNPQSVNRAIKRIIADYNATEEVAAKKQHREAVLLPDFSAHHLRHTFCTRLCENETNLKVIQSVMGHKDIQTTMDVYAEATEQKKQESFERLAAKLDIF